MITNPSQKHILKQLLAVDHGLRFSELKPEKVENDLLNHHIKTLTKLDLIEKKEDELYYLSQKGKISVEDILGLGQYRHDAEKFKLYSLVIFWKELDGQLMILNRSRNRHPFYGDKGIWGESVKRGETQHEAIKRRFDSQLGININLDDLVTIGFCRKQNYTQSNELFSDMLFYINFCKAYSGEVQIGTEHTKNVFWVTIDEAIQNEIEAKTTIKLLVDVLTDIKNNFEKYKEGKVERFFTSEEKEIISEF